MSQNSAPEEEVEAARITFGSVDSSHHQRISALDIGTSAENPISYCMTVREKRDQNPEAAQHRRPPQIQSGTHQKQKSSLTDYKPNMFFNLQ